MKFYEFMIKDNKFLNVLAETLKTHFFKVMDHAEEYNEVRKQINSLVSKTEGLDEESNDGLLEEMEELKQYKARLDERTMPDEDDDTDFTSIAYSTTICIRILRFLQLLCENHNLKLQDHLREQNNRDGVSLGKNFDFPTFCSNMFGIFAKHANSTTMKLGGQLIDTLIELLQGPCQGNQKAMITAKIIDHCRDFLSGYRDAGFEPEVGANGSDLDDDDQSEEINETKQQIVTLLVALLEGIPDHLVITKMSQSLDLDLMEERMYFVYKNFVSDLLRLRNTSDDYIANIEISSVNNSLKRDSLDGAILEGFDILILFQILSVYSKSISEKLEDSEFTPGQKKAKEFFASRTGRIEVRVENVIQRTYFPIMPVCKYLSQDMKDGFLASADRTSPNVKIRSLMDASRTMIMEMEHHDKVDNTRCMISPKIVGRIRDLSTFLAVIINILMLIFLKLNESDHYKTIQFDSTARLVIDIINAFQLAGAVLVIISFVLSDGTLILRRRWEEHVVKQRIKVANYDEILGGVCESMSSASGELTRKQKRQLLHLEGPYSDKAKDVSGVKNFEYYLISITFICTDGQFLYYLFYCTISILGLVIHPIWTAFLMIDFAVRFDMLQSITKNKETLGMTLILILIVLFIYSSFGFFFFYEKMYTYEINTYDSDVIGEPLCNDMIHCFISVLNLGLRNGGGIGDAIKQDDVIDRIDLFFYMFSFHIIVILIMLNIVFGIIIDTFAQLRDEKRFIENDQNNKCYICNLDRYIFDQDGNGFEDHFKNDHNMWNYLFYIIHLKFKDPTEYTGVESYVWEKYDKEDISWIPLHKAMVIDSKDSDGEEEEDEEAMKKKIEELYERLKQVNKKINKK
mmetsp:Transcript_35853/g.35476  ORF Transcript_35853/g.35476 Transcript_35853/m.35476 type:complete len:858 (-) Transcript_35853:45-2618(-)